MTSRFALVPAVATAITATLVLTATSCKHETSNLPPYGEALVVVDTDLPVPQLASRLRVDVYSEDGRWFESRDIGRSKPEDWPASFSVFSDDDTRERRVLVRLRAYPEGITRDYLGERFEPRPIFTEPRVRTSLADLCTDAPELPINGKVTLRAGSEKLTDVIATPRCTRKAESGSIAARVTIPSRGRYRFFISNALSYNTYVTLSLRSRCEDPTTQIACQSEPRGGNVFSPGHFPRFDADLDPGTYWVLTTGEQHGWPADLTLEVNPTDVPVPISDPITTSTLEPKSEPRLDRTGGATLSESSSSTTTDDTPTSEPLPSATIDRLLALRLVPGVRGAVKITMRGACSGTMARLGTEPRRADLSTAETCVDRENDRVRLQETPLDPALLEMPRGALLGESVQNTFGRSEPCPSPGGDEDPVVCVPGGAFLFGSRLVSRNTATYASSTPERTAILPRFWMDRYEVTIARFRDAVTRGAVVIDPGDINDNPSFPARGGSPGTGDHPPTPGGNSWDRWCSWSSEPMGREDLPVTCINWRLARAFCRGVGGDLPLEVEWEYTASIAGRSFPTAFPWGNEEASCDRAVIKRGDVQLGGDATCITGNNKGRFFVGPAPVTEAAKTDVNPIGIVGLGGGVLEWVLDGAQSFASTCWSASSLFRPQCFETEAPARSTRGGCWGGGADLAIERNALPGAIAAHGIEDTASPVPFIGLRCVYTQHP